LQHTRLATSAVTLGKVTTLDHELLDDAVEGRALVTEALLASGQSPEVLGRLGHRLAVETHDNAAERLIAMRDVEVDLVGDLGALGGFSALREENQADSEEQRGGHEDALEVKHCGIS
jgi:hypothetical protein